MASEFTRRDYLRVLGSAGTVSITGCLAGGAQPPVTVLSAGSLSVLFEETVGPAFETNTSQQYRGEFHGSNAIVRMVSSGQKRPDVLVSADASLLSDSLPAPIAPWHVVFASNEVVIAYNPVTEVGRRLEAGEPWYQVLRSNPESLVRSDPDLDPLGYRAVQLFSLAQRFYGIDGLAAQLRTGSIVDPSEVHLLSALETGAQGAAIAYKNMAVDRDLPFVSLPNRLNFSDPDLANYYQKATYTTDDGTRMTGKPVEYGITVPSFAEHPEGGRRFIEFLLANPSMLADGGLTVSESFPRSHGPVPEGVFP